MEGINEFLSGDLDNGGRSFTSALSASSAISGSSSSKAVLAALRALQDKIRRLETERSQALDETSQLRLQLKNQEIEFEHVKQREQLSAQKSLQEAKSSNERLLHEKTELEMKLMKLEEKTQQLNHTSDELHLKIRVLEEDKHNGILKIKELEHQQQKIEQQINIAQQKEKDMAQSLVWENKRHEEAMEALQDRFSKAQEELSSYTKDKSSMEIKLAELDQLVSQLLVLNESLVSQLSGKPMKSIISRPSSNSTTSKKKAKKNKLSSSSTNSIPRAADLSTSSRSITTPNASKLVPVKTADIEQLKAMHKMYAGMAKSLVHPRSASPSKKKSKSPNRVRGADSSGSEGTGKSHGTRMSSKKGILAQNSIAGTPRSKHLENSFDESMGIGFPYENPNLRSGNKDIRIPKPSVSFDHSYDSGRSYQSGAEDSGNDDFHTRKDFHDYLANRNQSPAHGHGGSYRQGFTSSTSSIGVKERKQELQEMISSLESEFDSLNGQYRQLLHNVNATSSVVPASTSPESIQNQAEEIVNVIQKLHETGEQLRQLKSPAK